MNKLSTEEKAKKYDETIKVIKDNLDALNEITETGANVVNINSIRNCFYRAFPELKESKDERIRKIIRGWIYTRPVSFFDNGISKEEILAWLEKQGDTNETINRDEFAQGVLKGAAINLITWIDYKVAEGNMCLSNTECKDIVDALVSCNWDKIYDYMKKKLEKQALKPKWTKEDEYHWMMCLECVEECATQEREDFSKTIDWLKSIKEKMEG